MSKPRIAIIGGGIVGLFTAFIAVKRGYNVVVYEANRLGYGASGHNAGVIHVIQQPFNSIKSKLAVIGNRMYERLSNVLDITYIETEALLVYMDPLSAMYALMAITYLKRVIKGFNVKLVEGRYVKNLCPDISGRIKGAIAVSGYKTTIPTNVLQNLARHVEDLGVDIRVGWKVESLSVKRSSVEIYSKQPEEYDVAVIAAGGDSARLAKTANLTPPSQMYAKGVMVETRINCNSIIAPLWSRYRNKYTKGGAIIPWPNGRVIIGPTFKLTQNPWDTNASRDEAYDVVKRFKSLIGEAKIINAYAGTRIINALKDDFVIQYSKKIIALYGIDSPGYTAAPALAKLIVDLITKISK